MNGQAPGSSRTPQTVPFLNMHGVELPKKSVYADGYLSREATGSQVAPAGDVVVCAIERCERSLAVGDVRAIVVNTEVLVAENDCVSRGDGGYAL